jgi:hypothetical protein
MKTETHGIDRMEADKWNEGVKEMLLEIGIWYHKSKLDD